MFTDDQSAALYKRACRSLATGVSTIFRRHVTAVPLYFERADGPYFYDVDGHELLDYTLAWGPLILGSNHPNLNKAVGQQLDRGYTYGAQHHSEIDLAELMLEVVPGLEQVIFSNTGTEAVQVALRLARAYTGRDKIIKFEGHYHGWQNNVLVSNHPTVEQLGKAYPSCGGQPAEEYAHTVALPWNDLNAIKLAFEKYGDQIACVITEPMLINAGSCMPKEGYLQGLIDLCRQHGAVSIFDEVITGFRIALGGARQYFDLGPDLSVYAKAIAGGFSMAAVGGRAEVFEVLADGRTMHAGTYNGNPIGTAAAVATIRALSGPGCFERMLGHGQAIQQAVRQAADKYGHQLAVAGVGTAFSVHFGLDQPPCNWAQVMKADSEKYDRFRAAMLEQHIQLLPEGRWYVGAVHTDRELDKVVPAIETCMRGL